MPHLRSERETPLDAWRGEQPGDVVGRAEAVKRPSGKLKPGPGRPAEEVADHQQGRIREALLDLVVEHGHDGITVRKLAGQAGVSTRSFYQHHPNKEACFLAVHQLTVQRVSRGIEAEATVDADQRLSRVVAAIVREWAADSRAAHLMLIDAYAAGMPALKQARLASRSIEAQIGECLDYAPDDASLAPLAAEGIVAGVFSVARRCLLEDEDLGALVDPLVDWATAFQELSASQIEEIRLAHHAPESEDAIVSSEGGEETTAAPEGDRGLLLAATARLVAAQGSAELGMEPIATTAGISRRGLEAEFPTPEACVAATHRLCADRALERVAMLADGLMSASDSHLPLASLGTQLAGDEALATICFSDVATAGPRLVNSHHRFLDRLACIAGGTAEAESPAAEASAGALWGLLRQRVVMGRATQVSEVAPALASLALLPLRLEASRLLAS